jgi:adenylate cyclase
LAATIGSPDRLSYLLVGDTVNLASRLQSLTREVDTQMILSSTTFSKLEGDELKTVRLDRLPPMQVRGRTQPVEAFALGR